jgi:hydrogenase nickel incorporation protein HypB
VTEGVDKPLKYPVMFRKAPISSSSHEDRPACRTCPGVSHRGELRANLARVMPAARALEVSATTGAGIAEFIAWLDERRLR